MSDTVDRVRIPDDVVAVNSKIKYSVLIGGQHITSQPFKAISASPSSMIFNIVVPSVETILDRRIMMKATCILRIDIQNRLPNTQPVNYGITDALAPFPRSSNIFNFPSTTTTTSPCSRATSSTSSYEVSTARHLQSMIPSAPQGWTTSMTTLTVLW